MATFTINGSSRTFDGDPNMPCSGICATSWA